MPTSSTRVFNFSAGPAVLPSRCSRRPSATSSRTGAGMSVMEMSHRSKAFEAIIQRAEADVRALAGVPDGYKVLFLQAAPACSSPWCR